MFNLEIQNEKISENKPEAMTAELLLSLSFVTTQFDSNLFRCRSISEACIIDNE